MEFEAAARRIMEVINEVTHHADGLNLTSKIKSQSKINNCQEKNSSCHTSYHYFSPSYNF